MTKNPVRILKSVTQSLAYFQINGRYYNWALIVEGPTDEAFYKKFLTKGFLDSKRHQIFLKDSKDVKEENKSLYKEQNDIKNSIIKFIVNYEKIYGKKNLFAIIDADYEDENSRDILSQELSDKIKITDAHSLETMMIKYLNNQDFSTLVETVIENICRKQELQIQPFLLDNLKQRALQLCYPFSLLRNKYPTNYFKYDKLAKERNFFLDYLELDDNKSTIDLNADKLYDDLIHYYKDTKELGKNEQDIQEAKKDIKLILGSKEYDKEKAYYICHGHNLMNFIEAIVIKYNENLKEVIVHNKNDNGNVIPSTNFSRKFIEKYPYDCFSKSPIAFWLKEISEKDLK